MIVVMMGVSGSGKTEVGSQLARKLGWLFYDGDDYHPYSNKEKMASGCPLTDEDRLPWIEILHNLLKSKKADGQNVVLACSALKKAYREGLVAGTKPCSPDTPTQEHLRSDIIFVYLQGSKELISERMEKRKGHYMPVELLQSQFDALEPPAAPEQFLKVNVEKDILQIVSEIQEALEGRI
ncbi:probable gluconokinase [Hyperolius riggenbachi]|uniref:probable gluconokinase n=1 Tax=Hyperolius riggenbachi TaxID=752182 RepID=UPI0035A3268A